MVQTAGRKKKNSASPQPMPTCFNEMRSKTLTHVRVHPRTHTETEIFYGINTFRLQHVVYTCTCVRACVCACLGVCVSVLLCNRICVNHHCVSFFLCLFPQKAGVLPHCHCHAASAVFEFSQTGSGCVARLSITVTCCHV